MGNGNADKGHAAANKQDKPQPPADNQDERLDHAIKETFPASDPVAAGHPTADESQPAARIDRKTPLIDKDLVEELAEGVRRTTT